MSSNIRINRICRYCGNEFEARKTTSKTCSDYCAKMLYKANQRTAKIDASFTETKRVISKPIEDLKAKPFLSIAETCKLLGISRRTIYRMLERGELNAGKAGRRTIIKNSDIDKLFSKV
jgi:excisionase family DNA binding protein